MATLIKTVAKTPTDAEWQSLTLRFNRGDIQGALGAAAKRARMSGATWYVFATSHGYQIQQSVPELPRGDRFYKITVAARTIKGELYES